MNSDMNFPTLLTAAAAAVDSEADPLFFQRKISAFDAFEPDLEAENEIHEAMMDNGFIDVPLDNDTAQEYITDLHNSIATDASRF